MLKAQIGGWMPGPDISIIVPCYNEAETIGALLEALHNQTIRRERLEVVISDGLSDDGTREKIAAFVDTHRDMAIHVVDNPERNIPAALNRAIEASRGETIIRLDAHAIPHADYVHRCLQVLDRTGAANVGGAWEIRPGSNSVFGRSIAVAASHPLGAGDARYRVLGAEGPVDTVPFGAYPREWIDRIGRFNERLLTNEDYEYNVRIRNAGGLIWFDPNILAVYFARGDPLSLARQYWRYGYWKARMLILHPRSIRARQVLPPLFLASLAVLLLLLPIVAPARWLLLGGMAVYAASICAAAAAVAIRKGDIGLIAAFPAAIVIMHSAWGAAFIWSLARYMLGDRYGKARA